MCIGKRTFLCGLVQFAVGFQVHIDIEHVRTSEELQSWLVKG